MRFQFACFLLVLGLHAHVLGQEPNSANAIPRRPGPSPEQVAQIQALIRQLGDEQFAVRETATKSLQAIGSRARALLEEATKSADLETAFRAQALLDSLPKRTHTIVDALGSPIPLAKITVTTKRRDGATTTATDAPYASPITTVQSDEDGGVSIPEVAAGEFSMSARIEHPDYGLAQCDVNPPGNEKTLRVPLVHRESEAYRRVLVGQVVSSDGRPVASAVIHGDHVRTPGEGLIDGAFPRGDALTDASGRFAFYLPNENRKRERGELIPQNSRYHLTITVPGDESLFPAAGFFANVEPQRIVVPRVTRFHRFRFEAVGGGWIADPEQLKNVRVQYDALQAGERVLISLEPKSITEGRGLIPGKYIAENFAGGKTVEYRPLVVTANSPDELRFELPHAVTYRGRVVHGVTGEPVAGAFVVGYNSTSHNNLALLTADDWKLLAGTPSNPPLDHPAIKRLKDFYGIQGLVRTGDDGRFAITRASDQEFYGIMAFAQDMIPFKVSVGSLKPDQNQQIDVAEYPLFPAAKLLVRPIFAGERLAVMPQWLPEKEGQPVWFNRFQAVGKDSNREFEYVHWLKLNEQQPVYVPAGIRLRVRFESPYDDAWGPALVEAVQLEAGASKEAGDLHFTASLPVVVRVVDSRGKPLEGVPVRRMYQIENAWCVAHNSDKDGRAQFYVHPHSQGQFRVLDLPGSKETRDAANLGVEFKVSDQVPAEPFSITLTDSQIDLLLKAQATPPQPPSP